MTTIATDTSTQPAAANSPRPSPDVGEEYNTFLRLLTAQIKNQDPLEPLDSTQFVEQLATFSSLEQQVRSNDSLASIATMMGDLHAIVASEWLGQTVSVESSWVPYAGSPVNFGFDAPDEANRAVLTIRDTDGNVTWSETLDTSAETHTWDGKLQSGETAPLDSLHQFSIDLYHGSDYLGSVAPRVMTTVTDVASENGQLRLGTAMNVSTDIGAVRKVGNK